MLLDSGHLLVDHLVGLAENLATLAVADDHVLDVQLLQKDRRHFTSERTAVFPVTVLGTDPEVEIFAVDQRLHTPNIRERRVNTHVDLLKDVLWQQVVQLLHGLDGLEVVEVHLPVA